MNYYKTLDDKIQCLLCDHGCKLKVGTKGICGVNTNKDGTLECLVYGYPCALHVDPVEKKPLYHFLPSSFTFSLGTVGCNFRCPFCQNWQISQEHTINKNSYYAPEKIVDLALQNNCSSIAYTYNEPTIFYPYARDIAIKAKENGLKNIIVTNGFQSLSVAEDMTSCIDAVNVDLKSFNASYYKNTLKGELKSVLRNMEYFQKHGIWQEITTLIIPTINDSKDELAQCARFIKENLGENTPWHLSAFHPDFKMQDGTNTPLQTLQKAYEIAKTEGLNFVYIGNTKLSNDTICPTCKTSLVKREYFNVTYNIISDDCCPNCNTKIAGIWS
ncbi:MAG: AmmeMemoRadiSam system radical SAM enzyme [Sulfurospirillaceae bacterium]|nr:AmmeMemoRadiSam system radical SAM enzyme [Sulfurospirillaceae bacterium]